MNFINYLRDKYGIWGWLGQRAHDASGINRVLPLDFIISCSYGSDVPYYFDENMVYSVEKLHGIRKDWSNEDLNQSLKDELGKDIFALWNSYKKPVNLLCYRSVRRLESACNGLATRPVIYAVPERLKKHFDNKILLYRNLPALSAPRIPGGVRRLNRTTFKDLREELSMPFVIQFPYGSSGLFTFIIRDEKKYRQLRGEYPGAMVIARRYINGFSLNANAIIISGENGPQVYPSFPSVQITGAVECSNFASAFCGNDFSAAEDLEKGVIKQVEGHMRSVGLWMASSGYRGIFGMDFVVNKNTAYPVEINPRFQNSTSLFTTLEATEEVDGKFLFLAHIAEFLQRKDKAARVYIKDFPYERLMRPLDGCQLILHNRMRNNIVMGKLTPGFYRLNSRGLDLIREGAVLGESFVKNGFLISCGIPRPYTEVRPNAPLCKIQMRKSALNPANKRKLTPEVKKIVKNVYMKLNLKRASKVKTSV